MSHEFGSYEGGYFHRKIEVAVEDCAGGDCEITRLWGKVLAAFALIAYDIAGAEAYDAGEYAPIITSIRQMDAIEEALGVVKGYLYPYEMVMEEAVRKATEEAGSDATS